MAIIEDEFPLNIKPITIFESLLQQDNLTIELDNDIAITYSGKKDDDEINYKIKNILIQSENDKNIDFSSILEQKELNNQKKENDSNNENEDNFNNENDEIDENNENDKNNKNDENDEFKQSNIFSIKYKDIYIGGISPNGKCGKRGFNLWQDYSDYKLYFDPVTILCAKTDELKVGDKLYSETDDGKRAYCVSEIQAISKCEINDFSKVYNEMMKKIDKDKPWYNEKVIYMNPKAKTWNPRGYMGSAPLFIAKEITKTK